MNNTTPHHTTPHHTTPHHTTPKRRKFVILITTFVMSILSIILFSSQNTGNPQFSFEQQPPMPLEYTIKLLQTPQTNGDNMIFKVTFFADSILPQTINIYQNGNIILTLRDDGVAPDKVAGDYQYSTYRNENITTFIDKILELENQIRKDSFAMHFTGHIGEVTPISGIQFFETEKFKNFEETPINALLIDAAICENELLKQNSLFITDLSVVEDPARTYNVYANTGNPNGTWTFGTLMKNIANTQYTNVNTKDLMKSWIKCLRRSVTDMPAGNGDIAMLFISPWISKAQGLATPQSLSTIIQAPNYWEIEWNNTSEDSLIKYAPFKLTAIVNRIDLRGNASYNPTMSNTGETRFIFSMVNPYTGEMPIQTNNNFNGENFIDWKGFNVILEYGNVQTNFCEMQAYGQEWYNLSTYNLGSTAYNDALESITNKVTLCGAAPGKPNKSAINRIRINEKCFDKILSNNNQGWEAANWQLRQMEIDPSTHFFEMAKVTNVPADDYNDAENAYRLGGASYDIINWAFSSPVIKNRIKLGNYNIPDNLLDQVATLRKELVDIYGFDYTSVPNYNGNNSSLDTKLIENQLSLNTCQGCHGGNNSTDFTQMRPATYGQAATYWNTYPDMSSNNDGFFDTRFYPSTITAGVTTFGNRGATYDDYLHHSMQNNDVMAHLAPWQMVSPFLTGRRYRPTAVNPWEDDELDENKNGVDDKDNLDSDQPFNSNITRIYDDKQLYGLFYINDPHNANDDYNSLAGSYPKLHNKKHGFNDLERRKKDLCLLLSTNCNFPLITIDLLKQIAQMPLPLAAH